MDLENRYIQPEGHKRHHYVPVCYLRNFTLDDKIAWIYNKGVSKSYPKNINDIFVLDNFYTIDESFLPKEHTEEVNPLSLELNYFARDIESQYTQFLNVFIPFIDKWINDENYRILMPCLPDDYVEHIAFQMIIQYLRTPEARLESSEIVKQAKFMLHVYAQCGFFDGKKKEEIEIDIKKEFGPVIDQMMVCFQPNMIKEWVELLKNKIWTIYVSEEKHFITSDSPVVLDRKKSSQHGFWCLNEKGLKISYPITKNVSVILWDRESYSHFSSLDRRIIFAEPIQVLIENIYMYVWAKELVTTTEEESDWFKCIKDKIGEEQFCRH